MQRTPFDRLRPGMITASNVFSADGRLLIKTDVPLTEPYLQRLLQLGIPSVYTRNSLFEDNCAPELLSEPSRVSHIRNLQQQFLSVQAGASWDARCFIAMAEKNATEVCQNTQFMVQLTDIRLCNEFIYGHSVNVAVLCATIGLALGYPLRKLQELALGGLLHDIGQMKIPSRLLNKASKLSNDEFSLSQTHTTQGFEILRQTGSGRIPLLVMHMALQHHEKVDGTGYPRRLQKNEIHEYARIAAVADVYDAMTCDRPYRRAWFPHEACLLMGRELGRHFDVDILTVFLTRVVIYPIGSVVLLSTGHIGVVIQMHEFMQNRPTVRLILGPGCQTLAQKEILDLREHQEVEIKKVLVEEEVSEVCELVRRQSGATIK